MFRKCKPCNLTDHLIWILLLFLLSSPPALAQINTEKMRHNPGDQGWTFSLSESMTLKRGNTSFLSFNTDLQTVLQLHSYASFVRLNYQTASAEKTNFENAGFLHWRNNWKLSAKVALEQYSQFEFDRSHDLDNRLLCGGGVRLQIVDKAFLGLSIMAEREDYDGWIRTRGVASSYLSIHHHPRAGLKFGNTIYLQPTLTGPFSWRLLDEGNMTVTLSRYLYFDFTINLRYESDPYDPKNNMESFDLRLENSISFHW